jgi:hypothetical protein
MHRRLGGPQSQSGRCGVGKTLCFCTGIDFLVIGPILATVLTDENRNFDEDQNKYCGLLDTKPCSFLDVFQQVMAQDTIILQLILLDNQPLNTHRLGGGGEFPSLNF